MWGRRGAAALAAAGIALALMAPAGHAQPAGVPGMPLNCSMAAVPQAMPGPDHTALLVGHSVICPGHHVALELVAMTPVSSLAPWPTRATVYSTSKKGASGSVAGFTYAIPCKHGKIIYAQVNLLVTDSSGAWLTPVMRYWGHSVRC